MDECISSALMHDWFAQLDRSGVAVRLDRGQIDLAPDSSLVAQAVASLGHETWSYPRASERLLAAARNDLCRTRGWSSDDISIVATHGAIGALNATFRALCVAGDEVLLPMPLWPPIADMVRAAGGVPRFYPFRTDADLTCLCRNVAALHASCRRPRVLLVNAPHNPTGLCLTPDARDAVLRVASDLDLVVVSDEAYEGFVGSRRTDRVMTQEFLAGGRGVLIRSMSKRFAAPGLRLGFVCAAEPIFGRIKAVTKMETGGISSIAQAVGVRLYEDGGPLEQRIRSTVAERRAFVERLLEREGVSVPRDRGGFYVVIPLPGGVSGWQVAVALREEGVGVVPGEVFGQENTVRLTLSIDVASLEHVVPHIAREVVRRQ